MFTRMNCIVAMSLATIALSGQDICERAIMAVNSGLETRSARDLVDYAARVEKSHRSDAPTCYAAVCSRLAELFAANARRNMEMLRLEQHYAEMGLSVADVIPIVAEIFLVRRLRPDASVTSGDNRGRWSRAALWIHAWHRIEVETIKGFNFEDWPYLNVKPPPGVSGAAGMSPESIRDPQARAQYEASIQQNNDKVDRLNTQVTLRRVTPQFVSELEHFFVESFSPTESGQIVGLFSPILNPEKERIIKRIADAPMKE
jgi:hypothetical protein